MTAIAEQMQGMGDAIQPATVIAVNGPTALVRCADGETLEARVTMSRYDGRPGDRLLVARGAHGAWAIAVLGALREVVLEADDGASARLEEGAIAVRDREGRLLFTHDPEGGESVVHAPHGNLRFVAPGEIALEAGRVAVKGGDVELSGRRVAMRGADAHVTADRRGVELEGRQLVASAKKARLALLDTVFAAEKVSTAVGKARHVAGVLETRADRLVERAKNVYRDVEELSQTRAGRLRQIATGTMHLFGKRTLMKADEDVSIKGEQIKLA